MFANRLPLDRRHFLWNAGGGLGAIALAWMMNRDALHALDANSRSAIAPHFPPKAKRVVQVFCAGGVSHLDTFDYKPELDKMDGKSLEGKGENLGFFGQPGRLMKSVYDFRQHGKSGAWVSSLLPHLAECVDDVCFIHSMFAKSKQSYAGGVSDEQWLYAQWLSVHGFLAQLWTGYRERELARVCRIA